MPKMSNSYTQQEVLEFAIRLALEQYELSTIFEQRHNALKRLAEATDNLTRWLEENPKLVSYDTADDIKVYPEI